VQSENVQQTLERPRHWLDDNLTWTANALHCWLLPPFTDAWAISTV